MTTFNNIKVSLKRQKESSWYIDQQFWLDFESYKIVTKFKSERLRLKLWSLFLILLNNKEAIISRNYLIEEIWQGNFYTGPQGLNHSICHLRSVLVSLNLPLQIRTIPKVGYVLKSTEKAKSVESRGDYYYNLSNG